MVATPFQGVQSVSANGPPGVRFLTDAGPCRTCGHAQADHVGPGGYCRYGYDAEEQKPNRVQREQCLCRHHEPS